MEIHGPDIADVIVTFSIHAYLHTSIHTHIQLYALAQKYDLLIVEDDPYRLLFLPEDPEETTESAMYVCMYVEMNVHAYI